MKIRPSAGISAGDSYKKEVGLGGAWSTSLLPFRLVITKKVLFRVFRNPLLAPPVTG